MAIEIVDSSHQNIETMMDFSMGFCKRLPSGKLYIHNYGTLEHHNFKKGNTYENLLTFNGHVQ